MKSKAARLLEKMSSKEKKTVYDVNGAEEVTDSEQKKMEKPCCCGASEAYDPNTVGSEDIKTFKNVKDELDMFFSSLENFKTKGAKSGLFLMQCKKAKKAAEILNELLDAYIKEAK